MLVCFKSLTCKLKEALVQGMGAVYTSNANSVHSVNYSGLLLLNRNCLISNCLSNCTFIIILSIA